MAKVTGIDIGPSQIHLVELDGSARKHHIATTLSQPRTTTAVADSKEAVEGEPAVDPRILVDDLKAAFNEAGATRERAVLAVSGAECILRNISLPFRGKDEIAKILKFEAEGYIHSHSIDDVVVDAVVVDEHKDGTELFMAACPKADLDVELKALHKAAVDPEVADLGIALLVSAARHVGVFAPAPETEDAGSADLVLDVGADSVKMGVVRDGTLLTARVLRWGLMRVADGMAASYSVSPTEMRDAIGAWFGIGQPSAESPSPIEISEDDLRHAAGALAQRINREVTRFMSGFGLDREPRRILVTGAAARLPGLIESLAATSGMPAEPLDLIGRSGMAAGEAAQPELDSAYAAALAGIGAIRPVLNFRKEELAFRPKFDRLKIPIAIAMLTLTIFLLGLAIKKKRDINRLEQQVGMPIEPKQGRKIATRSGKRMQREYSGLLRFIADPRRTRSYLKSYLDEKDANAILDKLEDKPVFKRHAYVVSELRRIKKRLEGETGYFPELKLESGLAVFQAFAAAIEKADADKTVGHFVVPMIHIKVGSRSRDPGFLKFTVSFRGDNFRRQNSAFLSYMNSACGSKAPFERVEVGSEVTYKSSLNPGAEYPYTVVLNTDIPIVQEPQ